MTQEELYEDAVVNGPAAIIAFCLGPRPTMAFASASLAKLFGYSNAGDFLNDQGYWADLLNQIGDYPLLKHFERTLVRPDGVSINAQLLVLSIGSENTHFLVVQELPQSRANEACSEHISTCFNQDSLSLALGIWLQDREENSSYSSRAMKQMLGIDSADPRSLQILFQDLVHPDDQFLVRGKTGQALFDKAPYTAEFRVRGSDGSDRWIASWGQAVFDTAGLVKRFGGIALDITAHRQTKTQQLTQSTLKTNPAIQSKTAAQSPGKARTTELKLFRLGAVCLSTCEALAGDALERNIELRLEIDGRAQSEFLGDAAMWARVLSTLVKHAINRSRDGVINIRMTLGDTGHGALVEIQDCGRPFRQEDRSLFEPTTREDLQKNGAISNNAFDLSFARLLGRAMGGDVNMKYAEQGLTNGSMSFYAPLERVASEIIVPKNLNNDSRKLMILIVEDHLANQRLILNILEQLGHLAVAAENGLVAQQAVQNAHFDLVLMDLHMPVMDGCHAIEAIRTLEQNGKLHRAAPLPIFILTADDRSETQKAAIDAGATGILQKPLSLQHLLDVMAPYTERDDAIYSDDDWQEPDARFDP